MGNIDYIYKISKELTALEKIRLIGKLIFEVEDNLKKSVEKGNEIKSLRGLWKDFDISISRKDIDELRAEMWSEREIPCRHSGD